MKMKMICCWCWHSGVARGFLYSFWWCGVTVPLNAWILRKKNTLPPPPSKHPYSEISTPQSALMQVQSWRRHAAVESEGETDGWPAEVLITGRLARCWAGKINLQRVFTLQQLLAQAGFLCSPLFVSLPSHQSTFFSPKLPVPNLTPISSLVISHFFSPFLVLLCWRSPSCLRSFFTKLGNDNGHFKHKQTHCNQADNCVPPTAFCVCPSRLPWVVGAVSKGQTHSLHSWSSCNVMCRQCQCSVGGRVSSNLGLSSLNWETAP